MATSEQKTQALAALADFAALAPQLKAALTAFRDTGGNAYMRMFPPGVAEAGTGHPAKPLAHFTGRIDAIVSGAAVAAAIVEAA